MRQGYQAVAGVLIAGIALVALLAFATGDFLLPSLGRQMDVQTEDYSEYADSEKSREICERTPPVIARKNLRAWEVGEKIWVSDVFEGVDEEGRQTEIKVSDILDEAGNRRMELCQEEAKCVAFPERGAYQVEVRAVDGERKQTAKRFVLIVDGR